VKKKDPSVQGVSPLNNVIKHLQKEFLMEVRNPGTMGVAIAFAVVSSLSVGITSRGIPLEPRANGIIFWIISYFSAMNALSHIFTREREDNTILFLKIHSKAGDVFIAKLIFNVIFFIIIQSIVTGVFLFFSGIEVSRLGLFITISMAGGLSLSLTTTVIAAMVSRGIGKSSLLTVVSFPISLPVLWILITTTTSLLGNEPVSLVKPLIFLLAFSFLMTTVSFTLFPGIWFDE
jgi:heme exporter protein B